MSSAEGPSVEAPQAPTGCGLGGGVPSRVRIGPGRTDIDIDIERTDIDIDIDIERTDIDIDGPLTQFSRSQNFWSRKSQKRCA